MTAAYRLSLYDLREGETFHDAALAVFPDAHNFRKVFDDMVFDAEKRDVVPARFKRLTQTPEP